MHNPLSGRYGMQWGDVTEFDVYCPEPGLSLAAGGQVWLDGIDGFYDQYFHGRSAGENIQFLVFPYAPSGSGLTTANAPELPFVTAAVIEAHPDTGLVDITEVLPFGAWLRSRPPAQHLLSSFEAAEMIKAPVAPLLA